MPVSSDQDGPGWLVPHAQDVQRLQPQQGERERERESHGCPRSVDRQKQGLSVLSSPRRRRCFSPTARRKKRAPCCRCAQEGSRRKRPPPPLVPRFQGSTLGMPHVEHVKIDVFVQPCTSMMKSGSSRVQVDGNRTKKRPLSLSLAHVHVEHSTF